MSSAQPDSPSLVTVSDTSRLIWTSDIEAVSCTTDPRCVAQYIPPHNATDLSIGVPEEERGVIPIWAINVVDYVRPSPAQRSSQS